MVSSNPSPARTVKRIFWRAACTEARAMGFPAHREMVVFWPVKKGTQAIFPVSIPADPGFFRGKKMFEPRKVEKGGIIVVIPGEVAAIA